MKLHEICEGQQHYQILGFERDHTPATGTSKQGSIVAKYADLVQLLGEPQNHTQDERADVNHEWDLVIKYKDPMNDDHQQNEDDHDYVDVSIYDYRIDDQDRYTNPAEITQWTVGAKSRTGLWVLDDLLHSKGVIE